LAGIARRLAELLVPCQLSLTNLRRLLADVSMGSVPDDALLVGGAPHLAVG
jgi:hypothetical protein